MISKKAPAFLGTPPGEGGGGRGKGGAGEGYHPAWQGAKRPKVGDTPGAGSEATNSCPCRGQQPPRHAASEGLASDLRG
jgi:hypothetical protein